MSPVTIVLLVILAVLIIGLIVLYFLGKKAQKKKAEQDEQLATAAQTVSMLIIDKKADVVTLRNLGASDKLITRIFLFEGRMISLMGAVIGVALGLILCFIQQEFGLLSLGGGNSGGNFVVDAYPVSVHAWDIVIVFVTVLVVGFLSVWYPVRYLSRRLLGR